MLIYIFIFIIVAILFTYVIRNHLHIDFESFLHKGFKKIDNKFGLYCYCGVQGEGKTYSAVKFCDKMVENYGYTVITNVRSYKHYNDTIYMDNILELIDFVIANHNKNGKKYIIFFDEIFTILMKGQAVNQDILAFLAQLRKRDIIFITTAQNWSEIPISFRRFCRFQVNCHMFALPFSHLAFIHNQVCDGYNARWNNDIQDFEAPIIQTNFSKGNRRIIKEYDTFETIRVVKLPRPKY